MLYLIKRFFFVLLFSYASCLAYSQIGIGINTPNPSAMLHVQDTAKGLLIPRMNSAQRINIQNPAEGLMVYQTDTPAGFWFFRSGQWNTFPSNGGGRNMLMLADSITDIEAQLKIANEVGPNTQEIRIVRCSNLTTVDLSMLTNSLVSVYIEDNVALQNVNLGNLKAIDADIFVNNCPQLATLNISSISRIGKTIGGSFGIAVTNTGIQDINLPVLKQVTGIVSIVNNQALSNVSMPQLPYVKQLGVTGSPLLFSVSFDALQKAGNFSIGSTPDQLTIADFSNLTTVDAFVLRANQLPSLSFPVLTNVTSTLDVVGVQLASATFPVLQVCPNLLISSPQLSTITAPLIVTSYIQLTGGSLNNVNLNSLQTARGITISASAGSLASITFPALQTVSSASTNVISVSGIGTLSFPLLRKSDAFTISQISSLSVPILDTVRFNLQITNSPSLSTLTFPVLKKTGGIIITDCGMTSLSFPALISNNEYLFSGALNISTNPNLASINWPNLQVVSTNYNYLNNNKLSSSAVNAVLAKYRAIPLGNVGIIYLKQIPAAPPTGQGITDKNYIISQGVFVDTD